MDGWTPKQIHEPRFERVWWNPFTWFVPVTTTVHVESEWSQDQVDALLGYLAYMDDLGPHGQPLSEAMSPNGDAANRLSAYYYEAGNPVIDHAAKAVAVKREQYKKANPDADLSYLRFPVKKVYRPKK